MFVAFTETKVPFEVTIELGTVVKLASINYKGGVKYFPMRNVDFYH